MIPRFRAWHKEEKIMLNVIAINWFSDSEYDLCLGESINHEDYHTESDETILMQSTGLRDKNGKEIFEGDIVRYVYYDGSGYQDYLIEFKTEEVITGESCGEYNIETTWIGVHFKRIGGNIVGDYDYVHPEEVSNFEIIGNIHENPEMVSDTIR